MQMRFDLTSDYGYLAEMRVSVWLESSDESGQYDELIFPNNRKLTAIRPTPVFLRNSGPMMMCLASMVTLNML